jgi:hypothetical protein
VLFINGRHEKSLTCNAPGGGFWDITRREGSVIITGGHGGRSYVAQQGRSRDENVFRGGLFCARNTAICARLVSILYD